MMSGRVGRTSESHVLINPRNENVYEHLGELIQRNPSPVKGRSYTKCFVVCIVINIGISMLSLAGGVGVRFMEKPCCKESMCVPCTSLVSSPWWDEDPRINTLPRYIKKGKELCCAQTPEELITMVIIIHDMRNQQQHVTEGRRKELTAPVLSPDQRTASVQSPDQRTAHVRSPNKRTASVQSPDQGTAPVQSPDQGTALEQLPKRGVAAHLALRRLHDKHKSQVNNPHSYMDGIVIYGNRLIIETAGLYYIYSQIHFKVLVGNGEKTPSLLGQQVHRYGVHLPNSRHQKLLQTVHTCAENSNKHVYVHSSYVGGVFHLDAGNELYVIASNDSFIYHDPRLTFFGAFKIGR